MEDVKGQPEAKPGLVDASGAPIKPNLPEKGPEADVEQEGVQEVVEAAESLLEDQQGMAGGTAESMGRAQEVMDSLPPPSDVQERRAAIIRQYLNAPPAAEKEDHPR